MKKCSKCQTKKELSKFNKSARHLHGVGSYCRDCDNKTRREYFRTKDGLISRIYGAQRSSSKKRMHPMPTYSKQELRDWLYSQELFHHLFSLWKASNHDKMITPSIDRLDDYEPYNFSNIQLMTWGQNKTKGHKDMKNGINNKTNVSVFQFKKDGTFVAEYHSVSCASRETDTNLANIFSCCSNKRKTAGGYKWEYKC